MTSGEKGQALELAIGQIEKQFGRGAIMRLGEASAHMQVEAIATGSISLDIALGIGGIPRGRVTEIFGPESAGKSTLAQHIIAEAQKTGGTAAYIDVEHALDPTYAAACGIKIEDLLISQPDTGEQALEITEALVRSNALDISPSRLRLIKGRTSREKVIAVDGLSRDEIRARLDVGKTEEAGRQGPLFS